MSPKPEMGTWGTREEEITWGEQELAPKYEEGWFEASFPDILEVQRADPEATWTWNEDYEEWVLDEPWWNGEMEDRMAEWRKPKEEWAERASALPSPFLGGDNVTILVTRTLLFSLLSESLLCLSTCLHFFSLLSCLSACNSIRWHYAVLSPVISLLGHSCVLLCVLCALLSLTLPSFSIWCVLYTSLLLFCSALVPCS
jgi:hypothetical protein